MESFKSIRFTLLLITSKTTIMLKSDLLIEEEAESTIKTLMEVKDYLIQVADSDDTVVLTHIKAILALENDLKNLIDNLPFITVNINELSVA